MIVIMAVSVYNLRDRVLSSLIVSSVSRDGIEPSGYASSNVNLMAGLMELMCPGNVSFGFVFSITKVSTTYLYTT